MYRFHIYKLVSWMGFNGEEYLSWGGFMGLGIYWVSESVSHSWGCVESG